MGSSRVVKSVLMLAAYLSVLGSNRATWGAITFDVLGLAGSGVTGRVTFDYTGASNTAAALTITVENTSASTARISGFAFNVPTISGAAFTTIGGASSNGAVMAIAPAASDAIPEGSSSNQAGWYEKWASNGIKTPNGAGAFDFGVMNASNASAFITDGRGSGPRIVNAADINDSTVFTFSVAGKGLESISDSDFETAFMNELSQGDHHYKSPSDQFFGFAVRFQGIPGCITSDLAVPLMTTPVPVPGAVILAGLGMGLVGAARRGKA